MSTRRFLVALGLIALAAFGVRAAFVMGVARHDDGLYDAFFYELQAATLVDGHGFTDPFAYLPGGDGQPQPAADHPPLTAIVFAGARWLFGGNLAMRFTTALAGVGTVVLLGLLGRAVAGQRAGLLAAGIGAVYPFLWLNDGLIMSEAFAGLAVTGALVLCYRLRRRPSVAVAVGLGVVCGLAALTRAELVLLAPGLAVAAVLPLRGARDRRRQLVVAGAVLAAAGMVIAPWGIYNRTRFDKPVLISSNDGITILGANCDPTYYGPGTGLWTVDGCVPPIRPPGDQSVVAAEYRRLAFSYMRAHLWRLPVVIAARFGRSWNLYRPGDSVGFNQGEGRPGWATASGLVMYYPLLALAVPGFIRLRRREVSVVPLLVAPIIVTVATVAFYGHTRLRLPAEPSLVVLAAVTLSALWDRWRPGKLDT